MEPEIDIWVCRYCARVVQAPKFRVYQPNIMCQCQLYRTSSPGVSGQAGFIVVMTKVE